MLKPISVSGNTIGHLFDHTLLRADAREEDIARLCQQARQYNFFSVCVNASHLPYCKAELLNDPVALCTVVGFPLGATDTAVKAFEAQWAREQGADEIDMVMNIGALIDGHDREVKKDIEAVVAAAKPAGVKVIIEASLLSDAQKARAARLIQDSGANFVKTSTGFAHGPGATVDDIALLRHTVGDSLSIKASAGIRSWEHAKALIDAGADRLGTSATVEIVRQWKQQERLTER